MLLHILSYSGMRHVEGEADERCSFSDQSVSTRHRKGAPVFENGATSLVTKTILKCPLASETPLALAAVLITLFLLLSGWCCRANL